MKRFIVILLVLIGVFVVNSSELGKDPFFMSGIVVRPYIMSEEMDMDDVLNDGLYFLVDDLQKPIEDMLVSLCFFTKGYAAADVGYSVFIDFDYDERNEIEQALSEIVGVVKKNSAEHKKYEIGFKRYRVKYRNNFYTFKNPTKIVLETTQEKKGFNLKISFITSVWDDFPLGVMYFEKTSIGHLMWYFVTDYINSEVKKFAKDYNIKLKDHVAKPDYIDTTNWVYTTKNYSIDYGMTYKINSIVDEYVIFKNISSGNTLAIKKNQLRSEDIREGNILALVAKKIKRSGDATFKNIKGFDIKIPYYVVIEK